MTGSWRLLESADLPFVYVLATSVDPRWWRLSRNGSEPSRMLQAITVTAAGALVLDAQGAPVACALLTDGGSTGTGMFEFFALPNPAAEALARQFAPALIGAAFDGAPIRSLYHERFANDPDVLGEIASLFELEVTFPDFALIEGHFEDRTMSVLTADHLSAWRSQRPSGQRQ